MPLIILYGASLEPHTLIKFVRGVHRIWRYGEAQGVEEAQKNPFGKHSTEWIMRWEPQVTQLGPKGPKIFLNKNLPKSYLGRCE